MARRDKDQFHAPSLSVQPVDTVGAGDSFNAGFLHKFMLRANLDRQHWRLFCNQPMRGAAI